MNFSNQKIAKLNCKEQKNNENENKITHTYKFVVYANKAFENAIICSMH